jgi:hypothetical protein
MAFPWLLFCLAVAVIFEVLVAVLLVLRWSALTFTFSDIPIALFVIGLGAATVWGAILFSRYLPTIFGKPYGVTFGPDGVSYRSDLGSHTFLRWDEMRLFEVSAAALFGYVTPPYHYRLYGSRGAVYWHDLQPSTDSVPVASNTPDGTALAVTLILERTGLQPRTFLKPLQAQAPEPLATP